MKILLIFLTLSIFSIQSYASIGTATKVEGKVFLERSGKLTPLKNSDKIEKNDIIITGPNSLALLEFENHSTHKIGEKTRIKVNNIGKRGFFSLFSGSLISFIKPKKDKKKHFRIKTKAAVVGVRGTKFFVSYGPSKNPNDSWVCVNEGSVEVKSRKGKQKRIVNAGEGVSIFYKTKAVSEPAKLEWTKNINWELNSEAKDLKNKISIEDAYKDLLDVDYD